MTRRTRGAAGRRRLVWHAVVYVGALLLAAATGAATAVAIGAAVTNHDRRIAPVPSTAAGSLPAEYQEEQ